tara:strand:+ start:222 stop:488 length:267 start_codon:yes stop_codon:yes gene_type:complete
MMGGAYSYRDDPAVPGVDDTRPLIVFDNVCVLCSGGAGWLMRHDRRGRIVPRALRDAAYRLIARNRYKWFGNTQACALLTEEQRSRLI